MEKTKKLELRDICIGDYIQIPCPPKDRYIAPVQVARIGCDGEVIVKSPIVDLLFKTNIEVVYAVPVREDTLVYIGFKSQENGTYKFEDTIEYDPENNSFLINCKDNRHVLVRVDNIHELQHRLHQENISNDLTQCIVPED